MGKKSVKEDSSMMIPLHRPEPMNRHHIRQPMQHAIGTSVKADSNQTTKDSSAVRKDTVNYRIRNGQQQ